MNRNHTTTAQQIIIDRQRDITRFAMLALVAITIIGGIGYQVHKAEIAMAIAARV